MFTLIIFFVLSGLAAAAFFVAGFAARTIAAAKREGATSAGRNGVLQGELVRTAEERARLDQENAELRRQLAEASTIRVRLEGEILQRRSEAAQAGHTVRNLEEEKQLRAEAEKAHLDTRTKFEGSMRELGALRKQLASARSLHVRCEQERDMARAQVARFEGEQVNLASRIRAMEEQVKTCEAFRPELARLQQENARLRVEMKCLAEVANAKPASGFDPEMLQARFELAVAQIKRARDEEEELRNQLVAAQKQAAEMRARTTKFEALLAERDALAKANQELRDHQTKDGEDLVLTKARLAEAAAEVERAEARSLAAQESYAQMMRERAEGEAELRNLRARVRAGAGIEGELERLREECDGLRAEHGRLVGLEGELASANAGQRELRIKLQTAEAKVADLDRLRDEAVSLREGQEGRLGADEAISKLQADLVHLRIRLQTAEAKADEAGRLHEANLALRDEKKSAAETATLLAAAQGEIKDLRGRLQSMQPKLAELERITEENSAMREQVGELDSYREASVERERLQGEVKRVRLEYELLRGRVQELEKERAEIFELRSKVLDLTAVAAEVTELRQRESLLEAQLFSTGQQPQTHMPRPVSGLSSNGTAVSEMENSLRSLVKPEGVRSAVLADGQGFPIVTAGDPLPHEGLAAFAGLAGEFAARVRTFLPLGDIVRVCLHDANRMDASCRIFLSGGSEFGLATVGRAQDDALETEALVPGLSAAIAAGRPDHRPS